MPGAPSLSAFWRLLRDGVDAVREIPKERWDVSALFDAAGGPGKSVSRWGGFLSDIDRFDWRAFRIAPREARQMDPQHRLLLEVAWEALEDAGLPLDRIAGTRGGVFVGAMWNDYYRLTAADLRDLDVYAATGAHFAFAANRITHAFDLRGPSMAIDVGCAASLTTIYAACHSLWAGESDLALAGGVNLLLAPDTYVMKSRAGILSPTGRCRTFSADADGIVPGEGVGLVVLRRLSDALRDGDRIHATVLSAVVASNGRTPWIMAVDQSAQEELVLRACDEAGVDPSSLDYVELHGTGTKVGDPVEARALGAVIGSKRRPGHPCRVGSVKTNVGHLESAAGIAHFIKLALMIRHGVIPASLHADTINPAIPLGELGLELQRETSPWPDGDGPRRGGVTSLSFGGANAHVILESVPEPALEPEQLPPGPFLFPLSARSPEALTENAHRMATFLDDAAWRPQLSDVVHTVTHRRTHHASRLAVVAETAEQLVSSLRAFETTGRASPNVAGARPVFVFTGQGAQWAGMGQRLRREEPAFAASMEQSGRILADVAGWSLEEALSAPAGDARLDDTSVAQPAIVAYELALADLWRDWGIEPVAVVGHSVGEIAAAVVAGVLDRTEALRLSVLRGRAMHRAEGSGGMLHVAVPPAMAMALVANRPGRLDLAAHNGPEECVISGDHEALDEVVRELGGRAASKRLAVRYPFHGAKMDAPAAELASLLGDLRPAPPRIRFVSTAAGEDRDPPAWDASYWGRQVRATVLLHEAIAKLAPVSRLFVEIGPGAALSASVDRTLRALAGRHTVVPSIRREGDERRSLLRAASALFEAGCDLDWDRVHRPRGRVISLPGYAWQGERMWFHHAPRPEPIEAPRARGEHPLLGGRISPADAPGVHLFQSEIVPGSHPVLRDHRRNGVPLFPAAAFLEMALAASFEVFGKRGGTLRNFELLRALSVPDGATLSMQTSVRLTGAREGALRIYARSGAGWTLHATGELFAPA
jgi:acyl transferase domain-containing protein